MPHRVQEDLAKFELDLFAFRRNPSSAAPPTIPNPSTPHDAPLSRFKRAVHLLVRDACEHLRVVEPDQQLASPWFNALNQLLQHPAMPLVVYAKIGGTATTTIHQIAKLGSVEVFNLYVDEVPLIDLVCDVSIWFMIILLLSSITFVVQSEPVLRRYGGIYIDALAVALQSPLLARDETGLTPLLAAASAGNVNVFNHLLVAEPRALAERDTVRASVSVCLIV